MAAIRKGASGNGRKPSLAGDNCAFGSLGSTTTESGLRYGRTLPSKSTASVSSVTYPYSRPSDLASVVLPRPDGPTKAMTRPSSRAIPAAWIITSRPPLCSIASSVTIVDSCEARSAAEPQTTSLTSGSSSGASERR
ncbi:hypothetical protein ACFPRL_23375 [Pseudoclavibacter helvolus]